MSSEQESTARRSHAAWAGGALLLLGALLVAQRLTGLLALQLAWAAVLLLSGVALIVYADRLEGDALITRRWRGEVRREGSWVVQDEHITGLVTRVVIDLTGATVPAKTHTVHCRGLLGTVMLIVPADVTVRLASRALAGSVQWGDEQRDLHGRPAVIVFPAAEPDARQVVIEADYLLVDVRVERIEPVLEEES